jgi:hypothetical protein
MATPYLIPAPPGDNNPTDLDARAAGIADAYDDHTAGTPLTVMYDRLEWMTSNAKSAAFTAYVLGYSSAVLSMRLHDKAMTDAQTTIAFEDQENAR